MAKLGQKFTVKVQKRKDGAATKLRPKRLDVRSPRNAGASRAQRLLEGGGAAQPRAVLAEFILFLPEV